MRRRRRKNGGEKNSDVWVGVDDGCWRAEEKNFGGKDGRRRLGCATGESEAFCDLRFDEKIFQIWCFLLCSQQLCLYSRCSIYSITASWIEPSVCFSYLFSTF